LEPGESVNKASPIDSIRRLHHRLQSVFLPVYASCSLSLSLPAHINQIDTMVKDGAIVSAFGAFGDIFSCITAG